MFSSSFFSPGSTWSAFGSSRNTSSYDLYVTLPPSPSSRASPNLRHFCHVRPRPLVYPVPPPGFSPLEKTRTYLALERALADLGDLGNLLHLLGHLDLLPGLVHLPLDDRANAVGIRLALRALRQQICAPTWLSDASPTIGTHSRPRGPRTVVLIAPSTAREDHLARSRCSRSVVPRSPPHQPKLSAKLSILSDTVARSKCTIVRVLSI